MTELPAGLASLVASEAGRAFPGAVIDPAAGEVMIPVSGGRARVSTVSLAVDCARSGPEAWPEIVRRWLNEVGVSLRSAEQADAAPDPSSLRLRVMPRWAPDASAAVAHQAVPYEFDAVLVAGGGGQGWSYLPAEQAEVFGGVWDAVSIGLRQTITEEIFDVDVREHQIAGETIRLLAKDDSEYVTTALLSLARFLPGPAPHGALVIAPSYSAVGVHEVRGSGSLDLIPTMSAMASDLASRDERPCSRSVYWWYEQVFHLVDVSPGAEGRPMVHLPEELRGVAGSLV